jgi:sugar phosphate isomerase/epimerase
MRPHPRLSINSQSSMRQSLTEDIAMWRALDIDYVGLTSPKLAAVGWDDAPAVIADAGLRVSNVACEAPAIADALEVAAAVGAGVVYTSQTGPARDWDEATAAFNTRMAPYVSRARELGVVLSIEPTNPLRADRSFVFTFRDAVDLARMSGVGVVLDIYACWYERGLEASVREDLDVVALVQIGDFAFGTRDTPNRVPIGDGDVPVERLLATFLDAGYQGAFDLEILGPRVEAEGYTSAVQRSMERASEMLTRLGA